MRRIWAGLAVLAMIGAAAPAMATRFGFSYGFGADVFASGTITIDDDAPCGPGCFTVANVTGDNRGATITGYDFFADSDQYFYPTNLSQHVDGSGLTHQVGATSYNIYSAGNGNYNEFHFDTATGAQIGTSQFVTFFNVGPAMPDAVPEPATWAMMIGGMALVGGVARVRRQTAVRPA